MKLSIDVTILAATLFQLTSAERENYTMHARRDPRDPVPHIPFPPVAVPESDLRQVTRPGHKASFGLQRPSTGQPAEYFHQVTPRQLWEQHVSKMRPAILRSALNGSKALDAWTDEYLTREFGNQEVLIERKFEDRKTEPKRMTIEGFLMEYEKHEWYTVSMMPNAMRKDLVIPTPLKCGTLRENLQELNLWIGTRGTRSMLHFDADHILHCLVSGRKDWMLVENRFQPFLDMGLSHKKQGSGFSFLDVDEVDLTKHRHLVEVPWQHATLYAGDCLFLPSKYLHQVRSYSRSISSTYLVAPFDRFDDSDCDVIDLAKNVSVSDVDVYWEYQLGQETIDMGYGNMKDSKAMLIALMKHLPIAEYDVTQMFAFADLTGHSVGNYDQFADFKKFFHAVDRSGDGMVNVEEVERSAKEVWRELARSGESPHGPTKSELHISPKKSNKSAGFLPRNFKARYRPTNFTRHFLRKVIHEEGHSGRLTFKSFFENVQTFGDHVVNAFAMIDTNMDTELTLEEVGELPDQHIRDFSWLGYRYKKDPRWQGGGIYDHKPGEIGLPLGVVGDNHDHEDHDHEDHHDDGDNYDDDDDSTGSRNIFRSLLTKAVEHLSESRLTKLSFDDYMVMLRGLMRSEPDVNYARFAYRILASRNNPDVVTSEDLENILDPASTFFSSDAEIALFDAIGNRRSEVIGTLHETILRMAPTVRIMHERHARQQRDEL